MPSPSDAATLQAYGEGVEDLHRAAAAKWGFERLPLLVSAELRAKFGRTRASWSVAYEIAWNAATVTRDMIEAVIAKAAAMQRAYEALDAAAEEAGHRPVAPFVWEVPLADGSVAALVQTAAEASKVIAEGRYLVVYSAEEVGHVIDALPQALQLAKVHFPGARFTGAGDRSWVRDGDPIPFGDATAEGRAA